MVQPGWLLWDLSLAEQEPQGLLTLQGEWGPWCFCWVQISGMTRGALLSCVGASLPHKHFICSHTGIPLILTFWGDSESPRIGRLQWELFPGSQCVGSGAGFHYPTLLASAGSKYIKLLSSPFSGASQQLGFTFLRVHGTASVFENKWLREIIPFKTAFLCLQLL